ncbi:hypothetical protein L2E82_38481 [Cichorium intybus]|uniref:Uncharacterized protein n=1 Tax=Cichorium intybus TaxID=13427 RepID=A0ACB9AFB1_CICIN|nr:hypothetical protein L2E82_38481 [Cichorium intybus]
MAQLAVTVPFWRACQPAGYAMRPRPLAGGIRGNSPVPSRSLGVVSQGALGVALYKEMYAKPSKVEVVISLDLVPNEEETNSSVQVARRRIFGRMLYVFPSAFKGENSVLLLQNMVGLSAEG